MDEETVDCVTEVLKDWVEEWTLQGNKDAGDGYWYGTDFVQSVVAQINREKERLFPDS